MSKTSSEATSSHLSSSDDDSSPFPHSQKGVATTSKQTLIKKAAAAVQPDSDSESETLVAPKKAKSRKERIRPTFKSSPAKRVAIVSSDEPSAKKGRGANSVKKAAALSNGDVKHSGQKVEKEQLAAEDDDAEDDYAAEDDDGDAAEDDDDASEDDDAAAEDDDDATEEDADDTEDEDDDETNNVCKTKKEWKYIGKKSIAMGLDAEAVNAGLEGCSYAVKAEIEEEWEQFHLEEEALFQRKLNLVLKESNCILEGHNK